MATSKSEMLKECRGRIGNFVIYQYKGRTCIRRLPERESIKLSPAMLAQQERVAGIAALWRAMKAVGMDKVWIRATENLRMSGYGLLVKTNSQAYSREGGVCDFRKLMLTVGEVQVPDNLTMTRGTKEGEYVFTWRNEEIPFPVSHEDDRLVIALVRQGKGISIKLPDIGNWRRKDGKAVVRIPENLKSYTHLYCYFCSATGELSSKSRYFYI